MIVKKIKNKKSKTDNRKVTQLKRNQLAGPKIMALTVPPPTSTFSEFGWIFHNNHLDSSIYQDDDIMEFSDSSAEYTTPPYQNTPQQLQPEQQQVSVCKSSYLPKQKDKLT